MLTDQSSGPRTLRYSRRGGGAHQTSPVVLPCRPSHPDFNVTIRRLSPGIPEEVAATEAGFDYYPSEGFVVPGSDIEDRDEMGFHAVLDTQLPVLVPVPFNTL